MPRTGSVSSVLDSQVLAAALEGLEAQRQRIDEQISQVRAMLGSPRRGRPRAVESERAEAAPAAAPKKRRMSASARKRIAAAQKKRWAEFHKKQAAK